MRVFLKKGIYTAIGIHLLFIILIFTGRSSEQQPKVMVVSLYGGSRRVERGIVRGAGVHSTVSSDKAERFSRKQKEHERRNKNNKVKRGKEKKNKMNRNVVTERKRSERKVSKLHKKPLEREGGERGSRIHKGVDRIGRRGKAKRVKRKEAEGIISDVVKSKYVYKVWRMVKEKWTIPDVIKPPTTPVKIMVKVAPTGEILEAYVKESSGLDIYDACALAAVRASSPLPPPPWEQEEPVEILFVFKGEE